MNAMTTTVAGEFVASLGPVGGWFLTIAGAGIAVGVALWVVVKGFWLVWGLVSDSVGGDYSYSSKVRENADLAAQDERDHW